MPKIAPTADPDISEVERLFHGGEPNNKTRPADIKQVIMILRSEIARLKDCARVNEERQAKNQDTAQKNYEGWRAEIIRVQAALLASQDRVCELQRQLLELRATVGAE